MLDQILAFTFCYRSLQKNVDLSSRGSAPMSPCRYASCLGAKARNEVLGLLRQRKLLNSRETGRNWNPRVFTRISFIVMKAFALMIFHTKGWPVRRHKCADVCVREVRGRGKCEQLYTKIKSVFSIKQMLWFPLKNN